jgi:hypothetical protein
MSSPEETCSVCDKQAKYPHIVDGLCTNCEMLWDNQLARLSKELPQETSLRELFAKATEAARQIKKNYGDD